MKRVPQAIQPIYRGSAHRNGVGKGTLLLYRESDIFPQTVAPILADIVRTVEEEVFLPVGKQTSRTSSQHLAPDTAPRQRVRYAFD